MSNSNYYSKAIIAIIMATSIQTGIGCLLNQAEFNKMAPDATFPYSYSGFCNAVTSWNNNNPSNQRFDSKDELAAFFGNVLHESDDLKAPREYLMCQQQTTANGKVYCKPSGYNGGNYNDPYCSTGCACSTITESDVAPGYIDANKLFLGRGAMQLSHSYNYDLAGRHFGVDLCTNPDLVATNEELAWGTAIWFWMKSTGSTGTTCKQWVDAGSFGGTVMTINGGLECPADPDTHTDSVVGRLNDYCIAANTLSDGSLLSLGDCEDLQNTFESCKLANTCWACNGHSSPPTSTSYCGATWCEANEFCGDGGTCAHPEDCPQGQYCFADLPNCARMADGAAYVENPPPSSHLRGQATPNSVA